MDSLKLQSLLSFAMGFLPPGFRFHPTDEEVVVVYLAGGGGSQVFIVIPEIDICEFEPEELPNQFKKNSMVRSNDPEGWFLCKQEQGNAKRSTREGYWKITGSPLNVKSREPNRVIGFKRFLTFYRRPRVQGSKDIKSNWVMHEYYLPDHYGRNVVVCHVMLKPDDKAVSGPSFSLPLIVPHTQLNLCNGSSSVSGPSISSDVMDIFGDDKDCNHSEDAIQRTMRSLLPSSFGNAGMNLNPVLAMQNYSGQPAIIRESRQTQPMKYIHGVLPIDEAEGFVEGSSSATVASKRQIYTLQSGTDEQEGFVEVSSSATVASKRQIYTLQSGSEAFKAKEKKVKIHCMAAPHVKKIESTASSSVLKEGKNSGQVTKLNCKTEWVPCSSYHGGVCSSTLPICYLVNLLVGFILLMVFLSQVF